MGDTTRSEVTFVYLRDDPRVDAYEDVTAEILALRNKVAMYEGRTQS